MSPPQSCPFSWPHQIRSLQGKSIRGREAAQECPGCGFAVSPDGDVASLMLNWFHACQHFLKEKLREARGKGVGDVSSTRNRTVPMWQSVLFCSILEGPYLHRGSHRQLQTTQENQRTRKRQTVATSAQGSSLLLLHFVSSVKNKWGHCSAASAC